MSYLHRVFKNVSERISRIRSLKKNVSTSLEVIYRARMNPSIVFITSIFITNGTISSQEVVETKSDKFVMTVFEYTNL